MSVSFKDFLNSAEKLLDKNNQEIDFRNLISRSYYALYHLAEEKAKELNLPPQTDLSGEELKTTHEKLIIKFEFHNDEKLKQIGREISRLKNARGAADYSLKKTHIFYNKAEAHLLSVKKLIDELNNLQEVSNPPSDKNKKTSLKILK